ncbi:MAG: hypothetical protein A2W26_02375 [Acidobacteria bacterium RBG_16_64_8]|nr:MAG: hypothetical protein A2W26_02375 [Acidobacteria bacterium RBG_16_64_8]
MVSWHTGHTMGRERQSQFVGKANHAAETAALKQWARLVSKLSARFARRHPRIDMDDITLAAQWGVISGVRSYDAAKGGLLSYLCTCIANELSILKYHTGHGEVPPARRALPVRDDAGTWSNPVDNLVDDDDVEDNVERLERRRLVQEQVGKINGGAGKWGQLILRERYLRDDPLTLRNVAERIGLTTERVRQIEELTIRRMRRSGVFDEIVALHEIVDDVDDE